MTVAQQFSQKYGIILTLKSGTSKRLHYAQQPKYLAVSWLSGFPAESQYILYGSHILLEITNIHEAEKMTTSHKLELRMFNKFQKMLENKIVAWNVKMVDALS
eukprot:160687_1